MKIIDLSFPIVSLLGVDLKDGNNALTANTLISNALVSGAQGDAIKFYDWAKEMVVGKTLSLDASDFKKLYDFIEGNAGLTILVKGQVLKYLDSVKENA